MIALLAAASADPVFGFGLGGALVLLGVTVVGSTLTLRGRTHSRLRQQVDLAYSGLSDVAVKKLTVLKDELDHLLPSASDFFDPEEFIVDPSHVEVPAKQGIKILRQRANIVRDFERLLWVCSAARIVSSVFLALVLASTALYFLEFTLTLLWEGFAYATVGSVAIGALLAIAYSTLNTRLQSAIEASNPIEHPGS